MQNGIIDLIIRIKNGYMAHRETIESPSSRFRKDILNKLQAVGYIDSYEETGDVIKTLVITLKYNHGTPALTDVRIHSTPGRRMYTPFKDLKPVLSGIGYSFLSTSKGIKTNLEARRDKVGGEILFDIW